MIFSSKAFNFSNFDASSLVHSVPEKSNMNMEAIECSNCKNAFDLKKNEFFSGLLLEMPWTYTYR